MNIIFKNQISLLKTWVYIASYIILYIFYSYVYNYRYLYNVVLIIQLDTYIIIYNFPAAEFNFTLPLYIYYNYKNRFTQQLIQLVYAWFLTKQCVVNSGRW